MKKKVINKLLVISLISFLPSLGCNSDNPNSVKNETSASISKDTVSITEENEKQVNNIENNTSSNENTSLEKKSHNSTSDSDVLNNGSSENTSEINNNEQNSESNQQEESNETSQASSESSSVKGQVNILINPNPPTKR